MGVGISTAYFTVLSSECVLSCGVACVMKSDLNWNSNTLLETFMNGDKCVCECMSRSFPREIHSTTATPFSYSYIIRTLSDIVDSYSTWCSVALFQTCSVGIA